ncbi:hypothetical protein TrST_g13511 [Triparma strigata]|uniref:DNA-directed DNA polymerase X domain-containing protein n=1 Tax=Triparma strigata TaxID=1606541 RepID=A0A9W7AHF1_9STRA|nr:hypothetical protein TrST_g13511 [Triparma strigata]
MGSLSNENTQQTSQSASLAPLSQPPPTPPSPAAASCSSNNSTSALSHPSTQSTLNTTSTPSVKTEKPVTWQKKRSKTINAAMFQGMLAKSSREGAVDGKEPFDTAEAMKNIADRKVEKFRPFNASWERLPGEQAEAEAAVGGWASISVEDAILNHMRVRDMATSQRKKYRRGKWTYAFERCLEAQKKADARMAKLQLEEDGGGDANVSCIFGTGIFGAVKIDVNNPEVFVPYNIAIAEYLREVAAAMTAKITVAEVMDRMRKGARGMNSTLKQEATCQKFRAEAYGRLATVVESFPVAVTADVLVNNQKKDDSSISSSSVTILLLKCPGSSLGVVLAAINRFTPQYFRTKKIYNPGQNYLQNSEMDKAMTLINDPQVKAVNSLTGIWGVGMSTAAKLYNWGVTSPEALWKDREVIGALNAAQLIGLKHVEDFKRKIPRAEVELILETVKETVDHLGRGKLTCRACGSYRRGKSSSGDIDVLITPKDGFESFQPSTCFIQIIEHLTERRVLTDHLAFDTKATIKPKRSYMGVCNVAGHFRRIDIKCYPKHSEAFALLYFTGSGHFNRSMKKFCKTAKLKLTDEGLWYRKGKTNESGISVACKEEEDIFNAIGLDYIRPEFRSVGIEAVSMGVEANGVGDEDSQETEEEEMWDIEELLDEEELDEEEKEKDDGDDVDDDETV